MPKLSPSNIDCKLLKWHVKEGMEMEPYSLVCEIETKSLTTQATDENLTSRMEIEIQEDCVIQRLLCREGDVIKVGTPIAILVEDKGELTCATDDILLIPDIYEQTKYQMAGWQAYVKEKTDPGQCGCS